MKRSTLKCFHVRFENGASLTLMDGCSSLEEAAPRARECVASTCSGYVRANGMVEATVTRNTSACGCCGIVGEELEMVALPLGDGFPVCSDCLTAISRHKPKGYEFVVDW